MNKKPMLALQDRPFSKVFYDILNYHLNNNDKILDPTYGLGHSWEYYDKIYKEKRIGFDLTDSVEYNIIKHDEKIDKRFQELQYEHEFNAIYFDPPYIWGLSETIDPRKTNYGEYEHSYQLIAELFNDANMYFPKYLKQGGLLFCKYCDLFILSERKFYFTPPVWIPLLSNFQTIDHYIIPYHRVGGTAYQVKNRRCAIHSYSYLTVLELKRG